jgi:thiamine biosynthesis lipoprotein
MSFEYQNFTFPVWGTVIYVAHQDLGSQVNSEAMRALQKYFMKIDEIFSPLLQNSELLEIRNARLSEKDASPEMQEVMAGCRLARELTEGAFDPWALPEGLDTSGYVKGWAAQKGVELLNSFGMDSVQINAAGDIHLSGGYKDGPWSIGIRDPEDAQKIVKVFEIQKGAIATSGTYEKGSHIIDPATGLIAIGAVSATVLGPDGGLAEALATALIVAGKDGATWFTKPELADYSAWVIERHERKAWGINLK